MKLRTLSLSLVLIPALAAPLLAEDAKTYSYHTSAPTAVARQSAQEIEDIGELNGDGGGAFARSKFRVNLTAREQFVTNARLSGNHGSSDFIFFPTFQVGYATGLGKYFHFDLSGQIESALYSRFDERSFYGYSAMATLDFRPNPKAPRIYIGAEPYRYVRFDTGNQITEAVGLTAGIDWGFAFNAGRSLVFLSYSITDYLANPGIDDRVQNAVRVGVAHAFTTKLTGQLYYSYQYLNFDIDRRDSQNIVGANLIYQINDHWFGSLTASFIDSDSTQDLASYQNFGASLGLSVQF